MTTMGTRTVHAPLMGTVRVSQQPMLTLIIHGDADLGAPFELLAPSPSSRVVPGGRRLCAYLATLRLTSDSTGSCRTAAPSGELSAASASSQ
jgi:hypothetical protein